MVKYPNPQKQFQFNIVIPGINPFAVQEVKLPDVEFDVTEHGDTNFKVKTAGQKNVGNMQVSKLMPGIGADPAMDIWMDQIQNTLTGGGAIPSLYKKPIMVELFGNDGITVVKRFMYEGCWPCKRNGLDLTRRGSENTMDSIEFCIDEPRNI